MGAASIVTSESSGDMAPPQAHSRACTPLLLTFAETHWGQRRRLIFSSSLFAPHSPLELIRTLHRFP